LRDAMRACHSASAAAWPEPGQTLAAQLAQALEADHLFVVQLAQALHVPDHDAAQQRQALAHFQYLVELLVVLDENQHRVRITAQVFDLARRIGGVNTRADAAAGEQREIGEQPFLTRVAEDRGGLADLEAELDQAHAGLAHDGADLVPRQALPQAELLLPEQRQLAALGDAVPEHLGHVVAGNDVAFLGPALAVSVFRQASTWFISMFFSSSSAGLRARRPPWRRGRTP
jgi:hypothetical protein